ncbi:class I SAM-dependent methyltransferase [Thermodesulfobium sp. 4217-1]|uniref:class I SAM-dependent methyltransferase n=1 Tax=Thermodesulfobium sp. 4217-1 TaxID=3120013 RepID=UPI003221F054
MNLGNAKTNLLFSESDKKKKYSVSEQIIDNGLFHKLLLDQVRPESVVLEVGSLESDLGRYLSSKKRCRVYGIDAREESMKKARESNSYEGLFMANLNRRDNVGWQDFEKLDIKFDHILMADVFCQLTQPEEVLRAFLNKMDSESNILLSLPNITNLDVILNLFYGKFNYNEYGILDDNNLNFFSRRSFAKWVQFLNKEFLEDCNLDIYWLGFTRFPENEFLSLFKEKHNVLYNLFSTQESLSLQNCFKLYKMGDPVNLKRIIESPDSLDLINERLKKISEYKSFVDSLTGEKEEVEKLCLDISDLLDQLALSAKKEMKGDGYVQD